MKSYIIFSGFFLFFSIFFNSCCVPVDSFAKVPIHPADSLFTGSGSSKKFITGLGELKVQKDYGETSCTSDAECVAEFGKPWTCDRKTELCKCANWNASESKCEAEVPMSTGLKIAISIIIPVIIIASIVGICYRCEGCYGYSYRERRRIEIQAQVVVVLALKESAQQENPIQAPAQSRYHPATAPSLKLMEPS